MNRVEHIKAQLVLALIIPDVFVIMSLQELSKIAMPVVFNEPLSFLQRISEYMEHTHLIHKACSLPDSVERMQVEMTHSDMSRQDSEFLLMQR